eukprot:2071332-Alexandrium_andersonii.AAC.1
MTLALMEKQGSPTPRTTMLSSRIAVAAFPSHPRRAASFGSAHTMTIFVPPAARARPGKTCLRYA